MIPVSEEVVENAKQCLEILNDDFTLDMNFYKCHSVSEEDVCNTTFCIAGWQARKDGYPEEYSIFGMFDYYRYSLNKVKNCDIWSFFYDKYWCNNKEYARKRMQFIIDNKAIPHKLNCGFEGFPWKLEEQ